MGNRVITIGGGVETEKKSRKETYLDENMDSRQVLDRNGNVKYRIDRLVDVAAVQNSLRNIFTWIPGERIINPEFGSNLRKLLYEQITPMTEERIVAEIKGSVSRWEPRVTIQEIINASSIDDTEDNTIRLDIKYKIKGLEDVFTYTYEQSRVEDR